MRTLRAHERHLDTREGRNGVSSIVPANRAEARERAMRGVMRVANQLRYFAKLITPLIVMHLALHCAVRGHDGGDTVAAEGLEKRHRSRPLCLRLRFHPRHEAVRSSG